MGRSYSDRQLRQYLALELVDRAGAELAGNAQPLEVAERVVS